MLPPVLNSGNPRERRLLRLFRDLQEADRDTLLRFAEFLGQSEPSTEPEPIPERVEIPRPPKETVVAAIRRLTATYPMLKKQDLLQDTSSLMSQHVLQGRPAQEVIDQLEVVFEEHYRKRVG